MLAHAECRVPQENKGPRVVCAHFHGVNAGPRDVTSLNPELGRKEQNWSMEACASAEGRGIRSCDSAPGPLLMHKGPLSHLPALLALLVREAQAGPGPM